MNELNTKCGHVVLAENDFMTAKLIVASLEQAGQTVALARDGREVVELFEDHYPDVLLLNMNLSRPNGVELLRSLKSQKKIVPVIGFISPGQADMRPLATSLGVESFFESPFNPQELVEAVLNIVRREQK